MYMLIILLGPVAETQSFQQQWSNFLEQAESMPHLKGEATTRVQTFLYGQRDVRMIHELFFETQSDLQTALDSQQGQAAGQIIHQIARGQVRLMTAEHKQDTIENLRKHKIDLHSLA